MIETKKPDTPWFEKFRKPEEYVDSEDFVKGYNKALEDFDILMGTAPRPDEKYRSGSIHGGNQIHEVCQKWRLEHKK